nr:histone deacetylase 14 [Tanacetum cinerariifolium]
MIKSCLTSDGCQYEKATATLMWKNHKAIQSTRLRCQLDEQWFDLTKYTLRDARQITPVNNNQAFTSPPSSDALINFVNEFGYPKLVRNLSNVITNDMFQPWRALTMIINLIWEEFTQSIHTFIKDKKNLAQRTHGKNKATLIVIPSIRFTKLIIYHLQRQHKFHPRSDSPLHLPNEEPILGYLKFSAKGTKREIFGMPIPGSLITTDIQGTSYYQEYLAKVAKHERPGSVSKRCKPVSSLRSMDESVAKDVPEKEPRVDDEEVYVQRALEESLKSMYDVPRDVELGLTDNKEESEEDVPRADTGVQGEGQAGSNPDREHMDLDVADVSI